MDGGSDRGWKGERGEGGKEQGKGWREEYELSLHNLNSVCSGLGGLWLFFGFVTIGLSRGYGWGCKRCPFTLQKTPFYDAKGRLLEGERA